MKEFWKRFWKNEEKIAYNKAIEEGAIALFGEKYGKNVRTIRFC